MHTGIRYYQQTGLPKHFDIFKYWYWNCKYPFFGILIKVFEIVVDYIFYITNEFKLIKSFIHFNKIVQYLV